MQGRLKPNHGATTPRSRRTRIALRRTALGMLSLLAVVVATLAGLNAGGGAAPTEAASNQFSVHTSIQNIDNSSSCPNGSGGGVDCNIYTSKDDVYLDGGPAGHFLPDGYYCFSIYIPSTADLLSTDSANHRTFQVSGGVISSYTGGHLTGTDSRAATAETTIQFQPYDNTTNAGGEYKYTLYQYASAPPAGIENECDKTTVTASKTDNFKVGAATPTAGASVDTTVHASPHADGDAAVTTVSYGHEVHDHALVTITGSGNVPAGSTVTFTLYTNIPDGGDCTAGDVVGTPETVNLAGGQPTATAISGDSGVLTGGSYAYQAHFSAGNTSTPDADGACEPFTVTAQDLTVAKTASPAFTRTYAWEITKDVDETEIDIADGGTATAHYTVTVSHNDGTDSDIEVTGTITVTNPNAGDVTLNGLTDAVDNGGDCQIDDFSDPVIPANGHKDYAYTCTYSALPTDGTNTATATYNIGAPNGTASGHADIAFGEPTKVVHDCVDVADTLNDDLTPSKVCVGDDNPTMITYSLDFTGDPSGTCTNHDNTATFTAEDDPDTTDSADATVKVCVGADLAVSKIATPSFARSYNWTIDKSVDQSSVSMAVGGSADLHYSVKVDQTGFTDSGWSVTGTISISNPNDWEDITANITDAVDNGGTCSVTGGTSVTIPKTGVPVHLDYTCTWASAPTKTNGTNTATATWDKDAFHTPSGSATGTADFAFTTPTSTTNKTITVTDTYGGTLGTLTATDGAPFTTHTYTYTRTVQAGDVGCTSFNVDNTATILETKQSDSVRVVVTVTCIRGKTMGFWGNKNGQALLLKDDAFNAANKVTLGSGTCSITVDTPAKSQTIFPNTLNGGSLLPSGCKLAKGINANSVNTLLGQTLALAYNIKWDPNNKAGFKFDGQTILGLNCAASNSGLGLANSSTVQQVLDKANSLITNLATTTTQAQIGAMNTLLGCLNSES